ncbi:MAG: protein kinase [Chloroflexota bacterium]
MKQVCLMCGRGADDRNLYCQEAACPAEKSPLIFEHGEKLADIEILKPVIVLRASTIYKANWQNKLVYLKIAHEGQKHTTRLIREATLLQRVTEPELYFLPHLQLPYPGAKEPYGRVVVQNQQLFYYIFDYVEGEPLSEVLARNPQPWIYHTCSIVSDLASSISLLQSLGVCHLALNPEMVLVNFTSTSRSETISPTSTRKPEVATILLLDLGIATLQAEASGQWYPGISHPAYTAPELLNEAYPSVSYRTDVYGLGLILYEMLIGQPAYPARLLDDKALTRVVREGKPVPMNRNKDVSPVAKIAERAILPDPNSRQAHASELSQNLKSTFKKIPSEKEVWWRKTDVLLKIAIGLFTAAFFIFLIFVTVSLLS